MSQQTLHLGTLGTPSKAWLVAVALGLLVGLYGAVRLLLEGTVVLGIDSQLPWGILISTYVFFVLLSTGICIGVTSVASVFGVKTYEPLVKRGVFLSIITLAAGGLVIMVSLGRPERAMVQMLLHPNPSSPMWWMIVFYSVYGAALVAEFSLLEWMPDASALLKRTVAVVALLAPLFAGATLGAIFGAAEARPYYGGIYAAVYMLVTAVLSGVALIAAISVLEQKRSAGGEILSAALVGTLCKYLGTLVGVTILLIGLKLVYGLTATSSALEQAQLEMLLGTHGVWYVPVGLIVGLLIPFGLLFHPRTRSENSLLAAAALVLVGMFASRLEYVIGGQVVALVQDPGYEYPLVSYTPSPTELTVVVLGFAAAAAMYTAGRWYFALDELPAHGGTPADPVPDAEPVQTGGDDDD